MIDPGLEGKVAVVTGANHGIGAATAKALAAQGVKVFMSYYLPYCRYSEKELEEARRAGVGGRVLYEANQQQSPDVVLRDIASRGGRAAAEEFDLGEADNIPRLFDACEREFGGVDILINKHTHCQLETFDPALVSDEDEFEISLTTAEGIDRHFDVNARAIALMMRDYLQRHIARGANWGRIINISADCSSGCPEEISYRASKHALESHSRSAAAELGPFGITVNIVAPGPVQSGYITPEMEKELAADIPLRRVGQPEDIADVILFLASEQARWVTGQLIFVHGGHRMSLGR